jgi:hypothetical protein
VVLAALLVAVAGCSMLPGASPAPQGQAEREVLVASFIDAVQRNDAQAIAAMTSPVVDPTADIAALLAAHGGRPWQDVRVTWGPDDFGGQSFDVVITAMTVGGPDTVRVPVSWDGIRATLGLGSAPGVDPGSATWSPTPPVPNLPDPTRPDPTPVAASPPGSPQGSPPTILLLSRAAGGASMEANVSGVLGISPQGCVTVAEYPLVAPPGSTVTGDGVHLQGIGDVAFGQRIAASGGVVEVDMMPLGMRPAGYEQCEAVELAVISAP